MSLLHPLTCEDCYRMPAIVANIILLCRWTNFVFRPSTADEIARFREQVVTITSICDSAEVIFVCVCRRHFATLNLTSPTLTTSMDLRLQLGLSRYRMSWHTDITVDGCVVWGYGCGVVCVCSSRELVPTRRSRGVVLEAMLSSSQTDQTVSPFSL